MVKSGQPWAGLFRTLDATGALATPSVGPAGTLYVDGVADGADVTISGSNPYKFSVTLPTLTAGQTVSMDITATIATIATASVVAEDVADTAYGSEALRPTVAGRTLGVEASGAINSVSSTISANLVQMNGETDPVDNLVLALGTGGLVEKLNSMLEAAGLAYRFTAEALAEIPIEAGSGTGTYTDTIKDPSNNPLDGARVQLSTDAAGIHRIYEAFTNALGVFVMNPDPGTYYRWIDLAGYTDRLTQGAQVTVT